MNSKEKHQKFLAWVPELNRPQLPEGWFVEEQLSSGLRSTTTYVRYGKLHHLAEDTKLYIVLNEINPFHWKNEDLQYRFTVRAGRYAKPNESLHYFETLKSANEYIFSCIKETDEWQKQIMSSETVAAYDRKLANIRKQFETINN